MILLTRSFATGRPAGHYQDVSVYVTFQTSSAFCAGKIATKGGTVRIDRLFRAIVLGGGLAATGCTPTQISTPASPSPSKSGPTKAAPAKSTLKSTAPGKTSKGETKCATICDYGQSEVLCPDTVMDNEMNCCWLMAKRHPCCDERPGLDTNTPR